MTHLDACESYVRSRDQGDRAYKRRCVRYAEAGSMMLHLGLTNDDTIVDVGAGWTELDAYIRQTYNWRGRYIPVDGSHDGTNLEFWSPPRPAEYFVALELLEHLVSPRRLLTELLAKCEKAVIVSVPNPETTDVLAMDSTHQTPVHYDDLCAWGASSIRRTSFYGKENDSLFAVWVKSGILQPS